jgi:hypothetical protein
MLRKETHPVFMHSALKTVSELDKQSERKRLACLNKPKGDSLVRFKCRVNVSSEFGSVCFEVKEVKLPFIVKPP